MGWDSWNDGIGWMDRWVDEQMDGLVGDGMDEWKDGQVVGQMVGWMEVGMEEGRNGWIENRISGIG